VRTRPWLARAALACVWLGVPLLAIELFAPRVVQRTDCGPEQAPLWGPDATVGWALIPNAERDAAVCDGSREVARHRVRINAAGYRDRDRTYVPDGRAPRVVVLGDSFTEALQVALPETFTQRLEAMLGGDVMNLGVSGYSTDNELRLFRARAGGYKPDVVLLILFVGNDVLENGARLYLKNPHGLPPKPWLDTSGASPDLARCLAVHRAAANVADRTPTVLWESSRVVRFGLATGVDWALGRLCETATGPSLEPGVPELLGVYGPPATPAWEEGWTNTEALLLELRDAVHDAGATLAVALAPAGYEYAPEMRRLEGFLPASRRRDLDYAYPYRRLGALLDAAQIPWLSLEPVLRAHYATTGRSGCYVWDGHWNPEGHAVVAAALEPFLRSLLRSPRPLTNAAAG
jgi:lysophospholipase L1-like esterase